MVWQWLGRLMRIRVTVVYAVILIGVSATMVTLGPRAHDRIVAHASTNLHNLSHGHLGTLLASAVVVDAGPIYIWLPGLVCLLCLAELLWGSSRLVIAFGVGHVGATLLVALGLTAFIALGWLPGSLTRATDVGMSYGAAAVVGSLTAAIPRRWRAPWIGWWLATAIVVIAMGRDFTDIGHAVALMLGMATSVWFGRVAVWTRPRVVMLAVGVSFGFLVLANTGLFLMVVTAAGVVGAFGCATVVQLRRPSRAVVGPSL